MQLGVTVTDRVTGFTGVVTGFVQYLSGCNQALVIPKTAKDGGYRDGQWFDVQRLDIQKKSKLITLDNGNSPGFDQPAPKR